MNNKRDEDPPQCHLLFYDGECAMCDWAVQFILERDEKKQFLFAPLSGETAKKELKTLLEDSPALDSVVLIEDYWREKSDPVVMSQAVFRVASHLNAPWRWLGGLKKLPSPFFDWFYRLIAKYRYRLFSHKACFLPTQEQQKRFLP